MDYRIAGEHRAQTYPRDRLETIVIAVARMWYGRAGEHGASEAEALLLRLGGFD